jgi:hypothetical protein
MADSPLDVLLAEVRATALAFEERVRAHHQRTRRELFDRLSQTARRLRQVENEEQWSRALVEGTAGLCGRAILFAVSGRMLEFQAARNVEYREPAPAAIAAAPAFAGAIESKDTVVALRIRGELSAPIVQLTGESPDRRCSLFPVLTRDRVTAILYADSDDGPVETSALDLLVALAGALPAASNQTPKKNEPALHLRAQRFARVRVAEIQLYQSQKVKSGRSNADLYSYLKSEIDTGRAAFRRDFLSASPAMADYFHLELVQTLANDDAALLGSQYPGPQASG